MIVGPEHTNSIDNWRVLKSRVAEPYVLHRPRQSLRLDRGVTGEPSKSPPLTSRLDVVVQAQEHRLVPEYPIEGSPPERGLSDDSLDLRNYCNEFLVQSLGVTQVV